MLFNLVGQRLLLRTTEANLSPWSAPLRSGGNCSPFPNIYIWGICIWVNYFWVCLVQVRLIVSHSHERVGGRGDTGFFWQLLEGPLQLAVSSRGEWTCQWDSVKHQENKTNVHMSLHIQVTSENWVSEFWCSYGWHFFLWYSFHTVTTMFHTSSET